MMRLALAAAVLAFAAAAHGSPQSSPKPAKHAKVKPAASHVTLRAEIVAGNGQTAPAYAEPAKSKYITEFPQVLVVHVAGWPDDGGTRRVIFHCETKDCVFAKPEQPNEGKDIDDRPDSEPATYKVHIVKGRASLKIAIDADRPSATYVVTATPRATRGEHVIPARFTLTSR
jgi:hypothetical protein